MILLLLDVFNPTDLADIEPYKFVGEGKVLIEFDNGGKDSITVLKLGVGKFGLGTLAKPIKHFVDPAFRFLFDSMRQELLFQLRLCPELVA